jgi:hypothetical protein
MSNPQQIDPNDIVSLIQDAQLEYSLKLSETKVIKLGKQTFTKKPLSGKKVREIYELNNKLVQATTDLERFDALYDLRTKAAEFMFAMSADIFDENYEKVGPIVQGHIIRINTELSPEIDFNKIREKAITNSSKLSNTQTNDNK